MKNKLKLELQRGLCILTNVHLWRKLNNEQREELLAFRQFNDRPWHQAKA